MKGAAAALALLALALAGLAGAAEFRSVGAQPAILYDAPSVRADRLFVASRYYPLEVLVKLDLWTKVRDANGEVAWVENSALGARATAVVSAPVADVHAAPDTRSPLVFEAYRSVLLDVLAPAADGWVRVRHRDGQEGYVRVSQVWGA